MSFLRVAAFDMADGTLSVDDTVAAWDATIGEYLRKNPDCIRATAAVEGEVWLVASEWTSREANETDMASAEYQRVLEEVTTKMGVSSDIEPSFLFEGDVVDSA